VLSPPRSGCRCPCGFEGALPAARVPSRRSLAISARCVNDGGRGIEPGFRRSCALSARRADLRGLGGGAEWLLTAGKVNCPCGMFRLLDGGTGVVVCTVAAALELGGICIAGLVLGQSSKVGVAAIPVACLGLLDAMEKRLRRKMGRASP